MTNDNNYIYNVNLKTPFFKSKKYVGIESKNCICIRLEEIEELNDMYQNAIINFKIDFSELGVNETRAITLKKLNSLLKQHKAKIWTTFNNVDMVNIPRLLCDLVA